MIPRKRRALSTIPAAAATPPSSYRQDIGWPSALLVQVKITQLVADAPLEPRKVTWRMVTNESSRAGCRYRPADRLWLLDQRARTFAPAMRADEVPGLFIRPSLNGIRQSIVRNPLPPRSARSGHPPTRRRHAVARGGVELGPDVIAKMASAVPLTIWFHSGRPGLPAAALATEAATVSPQWRLVRLKPCQRLA